jgi:hypothetical protein
MCLIEIFDHFEQAGGCRLSWPGGLSHLNGRTGTPRSLWGCFDTKTCISFVNSRYARATVRRECVRRNLQFRRVKQTQRFCKKRTCHHGMAGVHTIPHRHKPPVVSVLREPSNCYDEPRVATTPTFALPTFVPGCVA